jgi:hypothetical protein
MQTIIGGLLLSAGLLLAVYIIYQCRPFEKIKKDSLI